MKQYEILMLEDRQALSEIPTLAIDYPYAPVRQEVSASARICCTASALLVHMHLSAPEIRAQEQGPVGMPCVDSCLEFFFCPMEGDRRYFNFEFNPAGCMYLGIGTCQQDLTRLLPGAPETIFGLKTERTAEGFAVSYEIPYSFIRRFFPEFSVYPGKQMRANCFSCAERTEKQHFLSWNPILGEPITFHRADSFGNMTFQCVKEATT